MPLWKPCKYENGPPLSKCDNGGYFLRVSIQKVSKSDEVTKIKVDNWQNYPYNSNKVSLC